MPRKTSVSEQQPEENSEGALRRSSRIAQNSPAPAKIPQRRNSASSNDTPAKIKTKRLSLSQESNGNSMDSKTLPDTSKTSTPRKNRSTRSASKSPTTLAMDQETKAIVPKIRGRRG
ncbi:hypothetical protein AMK59_2699 [Oryctes borbonicus]|uniref:Uncharacterized protein n=1 Tax=Oryctes borbonicus TaxID=1629725 RepID=A0A0T6BFA2_9SCAR|nr:hypothetical protein AMK59_2699 [Oryctes borbonicus]